MTEYEIEVLGVVLVGVFQYLRCARNKEPFVTYFTLHSLFNNHIYSVILTYSASFILSPLLTPLVPSNITCKCYYVIF
jgi:hypothetical protein